VAADFEDWIDEAIEVEFVKRSWEEGASPEPQKEYTLEGADEKGILLGYIDESDPADLKMVFSPWHRIERIHLLTPWEPEDAPIDSCDRSLRPPPSDSP